MTTLDRLKATANSWRTAVVGSGGVFLRDIGHGLLEVGHNSLALLGLAVIGIALLAGGRADLRHALEGHALIWLQARHEARQPVTLDIVDLSEPDAIARATAADPRELSRSQAAVAGWLSRRYRVAPEPVSRLVQEAWRVGELTNLDPTLILAVMAVESRYNPVAESSMGARGLMQVIPKYHLEKLLDHGGEPALLEPAVNIVVGAQILREYQRRFRDTETALQMYAGALDDVSTQYASKVFAEKARLDALRVKAKKQTDQSA